MDIELSIIIPCFNVENYVQECLESVLPHMKNSCEVIIINDGSTDETQKIIESTIDKYYKKNITFINQENKGISCARNTGIIKSKGEYITFLDSDDFYDTKFWEYFPEILKLKNVDIIEYSASSFFEDGKKNGNMNLVSYPENAEKTTVKNLLPLFKKAKWFPWSRVYRSSVIKKNNIFFPENANYEDIAAIPMVYLHSTSSCSINQPLIHYRIRPNSLSNSFRKKDLSDLLKIIELYTNAKKTVNKNSHILLSLVVEKSYNMIKQLLVKNQERLCKQDEIKLKNGLVSFAKYFSLSKKIKYHFIPVYLRFFIYRRKK